MILETCFWCKWTWKVLGALKDGQTYLVPREQTLASIQQTTQNFFLPFFFLPQTELFVANSEFVEPTSRQLGYTTGASNC